MVQQKQARIGGAPPQLTISKPDGTLKTIPAGESIRLLGCNLNKDMTWSHQLEMGEKALLPALRAKIGALTFIGREYSQEEQTLSNQWPCDKIIYHIAMWGSVSMSDGNKLQSILNKCARMVLGRGRKTRTRIVMQSCNWMYFSEMVQYHLLLALWRLLELATHYNLSRRV